ncbi:MAG: hypothetical protein ABH864_04915 [archaeon]
MEKDVSYSENFYAGADYGLDANYAQGFSSGVSSYRYPVSSFGVTTDPRTANQLKAVSDKLNTGAKSIEVTGVTAATWETVPEPHLVEIYRLKKLTGSDLTFHGPVVEPTGVSKQGWNESHREQAERQMWQALERSHKMDPKGNMLVTFHSSNGLPDPETKVMEEFVNPVTGKKEKKEVIKEFWVVTNDGRFESMQLTPNMLLEKDGKIGNLDEQRDTLQAAIEKQNKDTWFNQLQGCSFHAYQGRDIVGRVLRGEKMDKGIKESTDEKQWMELYKGYLKGRDVKAALDKVGAPYKQLVEGQLQELAHGDIYLRDSYQAFQRLYNQAYTAAEKSGKQGAEDLAKLKQFKKEISEVVPHMEEPDKLDVLADTIVKGVNLLRSIEAPQNVRPLRDFGVEKSAETFANIAYNSYDKFKNTAPIVSIENPPAGSGLSRAQDLRDIVDEARNKLKGKLMKEKKLSESDAKRQAEKLIGATWDVGHINMLRKYGYGSKELKKETAIIGGDINKIHLSDNFGMEHTELPMGMGNVPTKEMFQAMREKLGDEKMKNMKKIIETGNWFGPQAFGNATPFGESLKSFGSPVYAMKMSPYWNQTYGASGGYFIGQGQTLPEQHFSMYGAGFSGMPVELGGQMSGRSRVGGTPME